MKNLVFSNEQSTMQVIYKTSLIKQGDGRFNHYSITSVLNGVRTNDIHDSIKRLFAFPSQKDSDGAVSMSEAIAFAVANNLRVIMQEEGSPTPVADITLQATTTALAISNATSLAGGTRTVAYAGVTMAAVGGNGTFTWAVTTGTLPTGLTLNATTGVISGTPNQASASTVSFSITATDTFGQTITKNHTIAIV